jgi:hypothetical protein
MELTLQAVRHIMEVLLVGKTLALCSVAPLGVLYKSIICEKCLLSPVRCQCWFVNCDELLDR